MKNTLFRISVDVLISVACLFAIGAFILILMGSLSYFNLVFSAIDSASFSGKMFWIGILTAIVYACMQFIRSFIVGFAKTVSPYFAKAKRR